MRAVLLQEYDNQRRKKSEVEILLSNSSNPQLQDTARGAAHAEMRFSSPPPREYKTEVPPMHSKLSMKCSVIIETADNQSCDQYHHWHL